MAFGGRSVQLKMSDQEFDFVCTTCSENNKTVEAVKYCVECSGYCCQACTDTHKIFPILKNHNLMGVNHGNQGSGQQSSLPEFPTERCSKHKGKVVDMYCEGHDTVGCSTCFVKDHKSCQDSHIHSIPDMIDSIFKLSDCKQTHALLKDMIVSMETACKSTNIQLQTLNEAKEEALNKLTTFQKALEAILRKAAESSRQRIKAVFKERENDILQAKRNAENIREDLQTIDDKLNQPEGNRAQHFVCSKLAEDKLKEADSEKIKQELHDNTEIQIEFVPDQSVMENIKALQGIGQVQKHEKLKHSLFKVKGSRDITIKVSDDSKPCNALGCCLTHDYQLLVTDRVNKKLKLIDTQNMSVVDYCPLDAAPVGVCCVSNHEVAVACRSDNKIQFMSIHNKMSPTKQLKMSHTCYGIAFKDAKLYVTGGDASLYVYDMTGTLLKTISQDNTGKALFESSRYVTFNEIGNRMLVGGGHNNELVCFDDVGNYLSTVTDTDLSCADGVCVDGRGNMFVVGVLSHNVVQLNEEGTKVGVVLKKGDGLYYPRDVCFHQRLNRMFVTMCYSDVVKMFELE